MLKQTDICFLKKLKWKHIHQDKGLRAEKRVLWMTDLLKRLAGMHFDSWSCLSFPWDVPGWFNERFSGAQYMWHGWDRSHFTAACSEAMSRLCTLAGSSLNSQEHFPYHQWYLNNCVQVLTLTTVNMPMCPSPQPTSRPVRDQTHTRVQLWSLILP